MMSDPTAEVPLTTVRKANPDDAPVILALVDALADYEKLDPPDGAAKSRLIADIFSPRPRLDAYLAEYQGKAVGYAFVLETYSSFLALPSLYLEDLFVMPEYRSKKVGSSLFKAMVGEAHRRGCGRMEWAVLDWNQLAIDFYQRFGARHMKDWHPYRLVRSDIERILSPNEAFSSGPSP
jgi:GNAT superfamily N-acetyltransferase